MSFYEAIKFLPEIKKGLKKWQRYCFLTDCPLMEVLSNSIDLPFAFSGDKIMGPVGGGQISVIPNMRERGAA